MSHGKEAARDLVHGRRGGRWKSPQVGGAPASAAGNDVAICKVCKLPFRFTTREVAGVVQPPPADCGAIYCRAVACWSALEWSLRARAAAGREAIGVELNDLDRYALANSHPAMPWWPTEGEPHDSTG